MAQKVKDQKVTERIWFQIMMRQIRIKTYQRCLSASEFRGVIGHVIYVVLYTSSICGAHCVGVFNQLRACCALRECRSYHHRCTSCTALAFVYALHVSPFLQSGYHVA